MSNVALFSGSNVPAFVKQAAPSDLMKSLAGGGTGGKRISIKGGVFRLFVDGKEVTAIEDRFLDVVIVAAAAKIGRTFYGKPYDSDAPAAPDCWSADGEKPDATAAEAQSDRCATCPQNVKGSGQGESRACRFSQRLAVVLANDVEGDVLQLQIPATSLFGREDGENRPLQAYARFLAAQNVSPDMVITRLKFDTKSEAPKLFFKAMRWLTEDEYTAAQAQGKTPEAKAAITMTVAQTDKVAAPLALEGSKPKAAAKPQAAEDDEPPAAPKAAAKPKAAKPKVEEEDDAEPTKKEAPPPAAKPSLAKLAEEWDDE